MPTQLWLGWVNVILGAWLITSPWLLAVAAGDGPVAWSSWSVGAGMVMLGFFAMYKPALWSYAIGIPLGAWLIASPLMLGFAGISFETANAVIIGLLVMGYALLAMRIDTIFGDGTSGNSAASDTYRRQLKLRSARQ